MRDKDLWEMLNDQARLVYAEYLFDHPMEEWDIDDVEVKNQQIDKFVDDLDDLEVLERVIELYKKGKLIALSKT